MERKTKEQDPTPTLIHIFFSFNISCFSFTFTACLSFCFCCFLSFYFTCFSSTIICQFKKRTIHLRHANLLSGFIYHLLFKELLLDLPTKPNQKLHCPNTPTPWTHSLKSSTIPPYFSNHSLQPLLDIMVEGTGWVFVSLMHLKKHLIKSHQKIWNRVASSGEGKN